MRFDLCFFIYHCLCCEDQCAQHSWLLYLWQADGVFPKCPWEKGGGGKEELQSLPSFAGICALTAASISEDIGTMCLSLLLQTMCPGCLEGCQTVPDGGGWPDCGKLRDVLCGVWQQSWSSRCCALCSSFSQEGLSEKPGTLGANRNLCFSRFLMPPIPRGRGEG